MFEAKDYKNTNIRICKIQKDYLKFMGNFDYRVPKKKERKFIGLIVRINNIQYVVPLTSKTETERSSTERNKRSPIITTFLREKKNNLADILHNNMFPVPEQEIINIENINDEHDPYLSKEYRYIRKKWAEINEKSIRVYTGRYDKENPNYHFLKRLCCDFKKLEEECLGWSYNKLSISLKDTFNKEVLYIDKDFDFSSIVTISDYGQFSRIENFDPFNPDLQVITIYAKDEFGQEKSISTTVKVAPTESETHKTLTSTL